MILAEMIRQSVSGAPSSPGFTREDLASNQLMDVAKRGILRTLRQFGILRCGELSLESVQQTVDHRMLALVNGAILIDALPNPSLE